MATFDAFTSDILIELPRCSSPVAEQAVRDAVIEFCRKTRVLKADHTPIDSVASTGEYTWAPGAGLKVVRAEEVWYEKKKLEVSSAQDVSSLYDYWPDEEGTPLYFLQEVVEKLIIVPKPEAAVVSAIRAKISVRPSRSATTIDDTIHDKYFDEIIYGAKARLFAMRKEHWFDIELSAYHRRMFESCIGRVAVLVDKGHTRMPLRSRVVHGIE
jgi:hypothetical protein